MRLTPLEWGLRAPITPRLGGNCWRYRAVAKSEPNEEKQTGPKHKTSDITNRGPRPRLQLVAGIVDAGRAPIVDAVVSTACLSTGP
jgi:hypothetical protein